MAEKTFSERFINKALHPAWDPLSDQDSPWKKAGKIAWYIASPPLVAGAALWGHAFDTIHEYGHLGEIAKASNQLEHFKVSNYVKPIHQSFSSAPTISSNYGSSAPKTWNNYGNTIGTRPLGFGIADQLHLGSSYNPTYHTNNWGNIGNSINAKPLGGFDFSNQLHLNNSFSNPTTNWGNIGNSVNNRPIGGFDFSNQLHLDNSFSNPTTNWGNIGPLKF